jgi:hypothetical protein
LAPLWDFIDSDPELTTFADAVDDAGLQALLDGSAPPADVLAGELPTPPPQPVLDLIAAEGLTVLAPINSAIEALPSWGDIVNDDAALQHFVLAHIVPDQLDEEALFVAAQQLDTLSGDVLQVDPATQTINGARLVVIDQSATNGIAHTVDAVLVVPPMTPPTTEPATTPPPATQPPAPPPPATEPPAAPPPATVPTEPPATGG